MVFNSSIERDKSSPSENGAQIKNVNKTFVRRQKSVESVNSRRPKSSSSQEISGSKTRFRVRSKTVEGINLTNQRNDLIDRKSDFARSNNYKIRQKPDVEFGAKKKTNETPGINGKSVDSTSVGREKHENQNVRFQSGTRNFVSRSDGKIQAGKERLGKKPSEIPKLKPMTRGNFPTVFRPKPMTGYSKLPIKRKYLEENREFDTRRKTKPENIKMALNSYRIHREARLNEKIKEAVKDDFSFLVPLCESEFQKIAQAWSNALYCSLTLRTNLVKLLHRAFPQIGHAQFQTEDETLVKCVTSARAQAKLETDSILGSIVSLRENRDKAKEHYEIGMANGEIAQLYNHDWKTLLRKTAEMGEEAKRLQLEIPELQKKKQNDEAAQIEKMNEIQASLERKEAQLEKLKYQLNVLKEKESAYKKNIFWKMQDYNEIKADVTSLKFIEKEFAESKAKYATQNEIQEKKIRDLKFLLDEKRKILDKERDLKQRLQIFLGHLQTLSVGKEQVDFVMGRPNYSKERRREQLWIAAVKLVLRGFLIQMKKLEKDRNEMLLELQSNDSENFYSVATTLFRRDNFIRSIKHQMKDFQKASKYSDVKSVEIPCIDIL